MMRHSKPLGKSLAKPKFIIISISANGLLRSAIRAGYEAYCLDCFADVDTCELALACHQVNYQSGVWDIATINNYIGQLDQNSIEAIIIGSGFERYPEQLDNISTAIPILSNRVETYQHCAAFSQRPMRLPVGMAIPFTTDSYPQYCESPFLVKHPAGCGGEDVHRADSQTSLESGQYFQQYISGENYSATIVATKSQAYLLGINRTWVTPTAISDFQYGGAMALDVNELSTDKQSALKSFTSELCQAYQIRGLAGFDFILSSDDIMYLIDINPRPSASFEFYDDEQGSLFQAHLNAFNFAKLQLPGTSYQKKGHEIIYALHDITIAENIDWPAWVSCIPKPGVLIEAGRPVCVVQAEASESMKLEQLLLQRKTAMLEKL